MSLQSIIPSRPVEFFAMWKPTLCLSVHFSVLSSSICHLVIAIPRKRNSILKFDCMEQFTLPIYCTGSSDILQPHL